ncbi:hypothetical protein GCM10012275_43050 [Longimycelium tulufanense]|uniref:TraD/TraG TraM recognition site domain-containing protein n=1 Tax=Longimycelium tulufanense TaxID=907463 RepID=A0A8J3CEM2_9PSEU|nr:type IV secretory system conjugative DNA transfer family protein [Longimycelium tulufanense]GGM67858.1 hypothetical protein GCM10012275_43050 [Longimycelium tulufanense]
MKTLDRRHQRVVRAGLRGEMAAGVLLGALLVIGVVTAVAGQLAAWVTGFGWPSWSGIGINLSAPVIGVYAHADDPMRGWPGLADTRPGPVAYWLVYGLLMGVVAVLAVVVGIGVARRRPRPGFATRQEVEQRLGATALVRQAARLRPQLVTVTPRPAPEQIGTYLGRDVHTGVQCYSSIRQSRYVLGPSESGKTSCVVIPEALDHDGPLLAPSSRPDVIAATWKARAERGRVLLFDPLDLAPGLPPLRWDPVRACTDPVVAIRRAQTLMSSVDMSAVSNGDTWKRQAQTVLRNLLHAAAVEGQDIRTVLRWTYEPTDHAPIEVLTRSRRSPNSEAWADAQRRVAEAPERQRSGVYMGVEAAMSMFNHPAVLRACLPRLGEHFDPASLLVGHDTVYMLTRKDEALGVADLLAALMEDVVLAAQAHSQRQLNTRLDPPLRILADEAANTTTYQGLPGLLSEGGGLGITTTVVVQDLAQAITRWGLHHAKSMWGAASVNVVLPGISGEELREIASYAGDYDEEVLSLTRGAGGMTEQRSIRTRPALTPAEVRALRPQHALVVAAGGLRPVLTKMTPYYQRGDAGQSAASEREFFTALSESRQVR